MAAADHVFDYETGRWAMLVSRSHGHPTFTNEYFVNQVNLAVITPPAGFRVCVNGVYWATAGNIGTAALDFLVSGIIVFRAYPSQFTAGGEVGLHLHGAVNEALTFNSTTGANAFFLAINYRIVR
jgi:hypothetical protein